MCVVSPPRPGGTGDPGFVLIFDDIQIRQTAD
jgi:hypothetical protein